MNLAEDALLEVTPADRALNRHNLLERLLAHIVLIFTERVLVVLKLDCLCEVSLAQTQDRLLVPVQCDLLNLLLDC